MHGRFSPKCGYSAADPRLSTVRKLAFHFSTLRMNERDLQGFFLGFGPGVSFVWRNKRASEGRRLVPWHVDPNVQLDTVNRFATSSSKRDAPGIKDELDEMPAQEERRELVPVIVAGLVAVIGVFCLWSDLKNDSADRGDGMITSAVVSRAGAIMTPSEPPTHLSVPQTVPSRD